MIKLKDLLKESDDSPVSLQDQVFAFFKSNSKKLEKLIDEDEWDDFYDLAFEKFPDADQDDIAQAMNVAAMRAGLFENETSEMPTEKKLETMSFGEKSQQKGIKMGDYDKKMKTPKQSPSELYIESKKKINEAYKVGDIIHFKDGEDWKVMKVKDNINKLVIKPYNQKAKENNTSLEIDIDIDYVKKNINEAHLEEAEYRGRKVKLGKPFYTPGGPRKRAVYVTNDKGNVVKVGFGEPGMKIKKNNPARRKSFRARHKCDTPGPRWKARYWSCRAW